MLNLSPASQNALPSGVGVEVSILLCLLVLLLAKDIVSAHTDARAATLERALTVALPPLVVIFVTLAASRAAG